MPDALRAGLEAGDVARTRDSESAPLRAVKYQPVPDPPRRGPRPREGTHHSLGLARTHNAEALFRPRLQAPLLHESQAADRQPTALQKKGIYKCPLYSNSTAKVRITAFGITCVSQGNNRFISRKTTFLSGRYGRGLHSAFSPAVACTSTSLGRSVCVKPTESLDLRMSFRS